MNEAKMDERIVIYDFLKAHTGCIGPSHEPSHEEELKIHIATLGEARLSGQLKESADEWRKMLPLLVRGKTMLGFCLDDGRLGDVPADLVTILD